MTIQVFPTNTLFYGDNLEVLQRHFPPECIDLIYLDPPFNSKVDYNILFRESVLLKECRTQDSCKYISTRLDIGEQAGNTRKRETSMQ